MKLDPRSEAGPTLSPGGKPSPTTMLGLYLRVLRYLRPYWGVFGIAVLASLIFAALDAFSMALLIPFMRTLFAQTDTAVEGAEVEGATQAAEGDDLLEWLLDGTLGRFVDMTAPPSEAIQGIIIFLLVIFLVKNVFDFLRNYLVAWVEQAVTRDLRNEVYDHLVDLDLGFFGRTRVGQIVSRLTHDVEQLRTLVTKEQSKIISSVFEFLSVLAIMIAISWKLTLVSIVVLPGIFAIWGPLLRRVRRGDRTILNLAGEVHSHIQETLSGIRLVKASGAEDHERKRFSKVTWAYFKAFIRTERFRALSHPITEMVGALGTVVILWYGTRLVLTGGEIGAEEFIGFLALSMKLYSPVKYLGKMPAIIQPGIVAAGRVFEFLDAPIEIRERPGAREFEGVRDRIDFEDVSFSYRHGEPVLHDISFEAEAGSVTALVGPSGAGKTTLVDLLGRFYEPTSGRILVDGVDLRDLSIDSLRRNLGIVSQETVLFHDTIRANIAYGIEDRVTQEEIERAADAAHASEFIDRLPSGYDTVVGERGTQLSGGQRQRVAIARAILRDPPILVLDEATSALDTQSERLVQQAIERLLEGRTVFVIAHRLSTIQRADRILVMKDGRVVQSGRHGELLDEGGLYGKLHALQFENPVGAPGDAGL
ncbi:MAG: ABC transporter ATP-binding protein [Gemmatimonadales bacterium]|nr:MAG: ABC transporter ATP-binding protein [Gemmatimonadales bacterium]